MTQPAMAHPTQPVAARIMVYSHDTFGLGNLRRMLAICEHLLDSWPNLSILLVSGSPMIHAFRLPPGLDYIKLPCLNRGVSGQLSAKYLGTELEETVALRSHLIQLAAAHFKPDVFLVDKKPTGLHRELTATLDYLKSTLPNSKRVLLLRDILDTPQKTVDEWVRWHYHQTLQTYYQQILVVGMQSVFDLVQEYRLPLAIACKVRYCGYIRKSHRQAKPGESRAPANPLVLVTPGGGEDGYSLIHTYLTGLKALENGFKQYPKQSFDSLILCGPEMPLEQQSELQQLAEAYPSVRVEDFTNDLLSCLKAASVVVSMGGYNTITEILSLGRPAVVVPRVHPSQEQFIRANCFAQKNWISVVHPAQATGEVLMQAVLTQLEQPLSPPDDIDFNGVAQVAAHLSQLMRPPQQPQMPPLKSLSA